MHAAVFVDAEIEDVKIETGTTSSSKPMKIHSKEPHRADTAN
jgi:hypothetical protein